MDTRAWRAHIMMMKTLSFPEWKMIHPFLIFVNISVLFSLFPPLFSFLFFFPDGSEVN